MTARTLRPAPVSSRQISWGSQVGTAEMSDLNGLGRVWADSADEGLTVVSTRTGREVVCVVTDVEYQEGDLVLWKLMPVEDGLTWTLTVFND